ncbi:MAG: hypothetical protein WB974_18520 [Acidobacteriaceae bacterium]
MAERFTPSRRSSWGRCWLEGAGAAILLSPGLLWSELSRTHIDLYHRLLPLTTVDRALAIDLILLSLAAMVATRLLDRIARPRDSGRRMVLLLWAVWFGLLAARAAAGAIVAQVVWWQQITTGRVFLLTVVGCGLVWLVSGRAWRQMVRGVRFGLLMLGFCLFWMIPVLVTASLARQPWDQASFRKPVPAAAPGHRRIVWLLFDEMSYEQVFVHRFPGLELPNLDGLRGESVTFSDVRPDGYFTEDVIPSLLLGEPIDQVRGTPSGWMSYQSRRHGPWQRFDGSRTLFADAEREGWTTGAIGSYNPYCRILKDQLDFCWMDLPPLPDHFSRDRTTVGNVVAPVVANWDKILDGGARGESRGSLDSIPAVRAGDALIGDAPIELCFVHLPMPHPPGGYDRHTGKIGPGGSYIDNLALSDRILGQMLADIAASPAADRTTVILSSDHSWRTFLWRHAFGWTREDELASDHGKFEPRPMLMVRFPGERTAAEVSGPVPLLGMHDLIEQLMAGQIGNPQQLEGWAGEQRDPGPAAR